MTGALRHLHVRSAELSPWVEQLKALERDVWYPIDDGKDRFVLSHGDAYHPFFSAMGQAHFVLALAGDEVVGCVAAVRKKVRGPRGGEVAAAYLGDLKVARAWRGRGVPASLLFFALKTWSRAPFELSWRFAFGAAMRGAKGDVMRSARGVTPMKLGAAVAVLDVYFEPPARLAQLDVSTAPQLRLEGLLDLSPAEQREVVSTAGSKDYVLESSGKPWALLHLPRGPAGWGASHASYLQRFLASQGVRPGAACTVYGLSTSFGTWNAAWVHLATSEI
jgi:GNAT superfamily N-acetyltransferase